MNQTQYIFTFIIVITWLIGFFILVIKLDEHCNLYATGRRSWFWCPSPEEQDDTVVAEEI